MTVRSFPEILSDLSGLAVPKTDNPLHTGPVFYSTLHYEEGDTDFQRPSYLLIDSRVDVRCPLYLVFKNGRFELLPCNPDVGALSYRDPEPFFAPLWLEKLSVLCGQAILPHVEALNRIPFLEEEDGKPNFTKHACEQVIYDQLESFRFHRLTFFLSVDAWLQWECWSRAKSWLISSISSESACEIVGGECPSYCALMEKTLTRCRAEFSQFEIPAAECFDVASTPESSATLVESVMKRFVDPTSVIGAPNLNIPKDEECVWMANFLEFEGRQKREPYTIWWWRKLNLREDCSDDLLQIFYQNWARSALLYEYRCRKYRKSEEPWFGVPWVTLNHVQRAILRELWPPETGGPKTFVRPGIPGLSEFGKLSRVTLQIPVDLQKMSNGSILKIVEEEINRLRAERGFPNFPQGEGGTSSQARWKALEAMDKSVFKGESLSPSDRNAKYHVEMKYQEACVAAGIEP